MKKITHRILWEGAGMPQMVGPLPHFARRNEIEKLLVAELDRQFANGDLAYLSRREDHPDEIVVWDSYDEDGRHISVNGRINVTALVDAFLEHSS